MTLYFARRAALLFGVLLILCTGVAGATPLGEITQFAAVGSNAVDQAIAELVAAGRVRTDGKEVRAT